MSASGERLDGKLGTVSYLCVWLRIDQYCDTPTVEINHHQLPPTTPHIEFLLWCPTHRPGLHWFFQPHKLLVSFLVVHLGHVRRREEPNTTSSAHSRPSWVLINEVSGAGECWDIRRGSAANVCCFLRQLHLPETEEKMTLIQKSH